MCCYMFIMNWFPMLNLCVLYVVLYCVLNMAFWFLAITFCCRVCDRETNVFDFTSAYFVSYESGPFLVEVGAKDPIELHIPSHMQVMTKIHLSIANVICLVKRIRKFLGLTLCNDDYDNTTRRWIFYRHSPIGEPS